MPRPRIFISHSAADDPALLWQVHGALEAAGFEVLMDAARLQPGADWRNEIYTWIHRAHGAVVLLTEAALKSKWVKFELAALASRRLLENVKLVPMLVSPVTDAALREEQFEPYDLAKLQAATIDAAAPGYVGRVVDVFRPLLAAFSDTPIDLLEATVAKELPPENDVLERAAQALRAQGVIDPPLVARSFFHAAVETIQSALTEVARGKGVSRSQLRLILDVVTPFWVEPECVLELAREAAAPAGPHRILLVNTGDRTIGLMYVRRAALQYPMTWAVIPLSAAGGDDPVGDMVGDLRDWFRKLDPDMLAWADDAEVDSRIADVSASTPVIVVLPATTKLERVAELRDRYPHCIYVRLAGTDIPDDATLQEKNSIVLEPRLETQREKTIKTEYGKCVLVVNNTRA